MDFLSSLIREHNQTVKGDGSLSLEQLDRLVEQVPEEQFIVLRPGTIPELETFLQQDAQVDQA